MNYQKEKKKKKRTFKAVESATGQGNVKNLVKPGNSGTEHS